MATLKEYKFLRQKYKDLINGYIRTVQILISSKQNTYYNIPFSINQLCTIYYHNRGAFNTKLCSTNLKFIDDETVEKINDNNYALCLFGEPITESMCKIFRIEFTVIQIGDQDKFCPYFGFAAAFSPSALMSFFESMKTWNISYPSGDQIYSYAVSMYNKGPRPFYYHDNVYSDKAKEISDVSVNDTFMFVHNFGESMCRVLHNNKKLHSFEMKEKCIIPTLSIYFKGEQTMVTKYEFD